MDLVAPAIHTLSKSRFHPSAMDDAIARAARGMRGTESTIGVYLDERVIGMVRGKSASSDVRFAPVTERQWCGFNTYDDMEAAMNNGKLLRSVVCKNAAGWSTANVWADYWSCGPREVGGYTGSANTAKPLDKDTPGAHDIRLKTPGAGETRHLTGVYMANFNIGGGAAVCGNELWWYDRTLTYPGCSITTVTTTLTNTLPAARHIAAGQDGLQILVTAEVALGAVASNLSSVVITDNAGNTAVSLTPGYTMPWYTSAPATSFTVPAPVAAPHDNVNTQTIAAWLPLPPGVRGARKIESFASSVINTGTVSFSLIKPIACMALAGIRIGHTLEFPKSGFQLPRIYDDACISCLGLSFFNNGSGSYVTGLLGTLDMVWS